MLTDILPPNARKVFYAVFALIGVAIGATQVAYEAAGAAQPMWLAVAFAVYGFLGMAFGATAAANTPPPPSIVPKARNEHGYFNPGRVAQLVVIVGAVVVVGVLLLILVP